MNTIVSFILVLGVLIFVHELGHVVDLGLLKGKNRQASEFRDGSTPIYSDDQSLNFYRILFLTLRKQRISTCLSMC